MVAVQELPALVEDRPAHRAPLHIREPARVGAGLIDARYELRHGLLNGEGFAECPYNPLLRNRVALLPRRPVAHLCRARHFRPFRHIPPVSVVPQHPAAGKEGLVAICEDILAVTAAAGPVHQPDRLECCRVENLHPDEACRLPGYGLILVSGARRIQGDDDAQPRRGALMLPRGIDGIGAPQRIHRVQHLLGAPRLNGVRIQRDKVALPGVLVFAARPFQRAPYKPADVLQGVLFRPGEGFVLPQAFLRPHGLRKPLHEVRPVQFLPNPGSRLPACSCCNPYKPVVLQHAPPPSPSYNNGPRTRLRPAAAQPPTLAACT